MRPIKRLASSYIVTRLSPFAWEYDAEQPPSRWVSRTTGTLELVLRPEFESEFWRLAEEELEKDLSDANDDD